MITEDASAKMDASLLSKLEQWPAPTGKPPTIYNLAVLAQVYSTSPGLLVSAADLAELPARDRIALQTITTTAPASNTTALAEPAEQTPNHTRRVHQNRPPQSLATGDANQAPSSDVSPIPSTSPDTTQAFGTVACQSDTGWVEMLRRTVLKLPVATAVAQLTTAGGVAASGSLDPVIVRGLAAVSEGYRNAYQTVAASRLLPAALSHLDLLTALRPASRPDTERVPLVTAAGETAALAGVLLTLDARRHEEALAYFDIAWGAARATNNIELQTVVLGCRSFALAYGAGDHKAGLECSDLARRVGARGACPQTRAWVAAVASERCASLGDLAGCQARLDESRAALSSTELAEVTWRGVGGYGADKLLAYEGGDMTRLGRYHEAETVLDTALAGLSANMTRHRATALLDRADARLGLGELEAACADASKALLLVADVEHTSHLNRVEAFRTRVGAVESSAAQSLGQELQLVCLDHRLPIKGNP